jgi:hypothetical protein
MIYQIGQSTEEICATIFLSSSVVNDDCYSRFGWNFLFNKKIKYACTF